MKIAYVVSDLKRVGPTNQTLNIITNSDYRKDSIVITLFRETNDSMLSEYEDHGIKVISLNLSRYTFIFYGHKALKMILERYNIDLVHSYGVKPDAICQKVCKSLGIPHVITLRNYPKEDIPLRMRGIKKFIALGSHLGTLKKSNNIVACSKTIADRMIRDYPAMNIVVIQNGVNIATFNNDKRMNKKRIRKKLGLPIDKVIIISTSSFTKRKRIEESINGFLKVDDDDFIFVLLGFGEDFNRIKNKYKKEERIIFKGKVDEVACYLKASDIFISSSESEGLPNGVIEAIACGVPVVLSDISQHVEILDEVPHSGINYKLGDTSGLAKCLKDSILFDNSKSSINNSNLTMENMGKNYSKYYREVVNE